VYQTFIGLDYYLPLYFQSVLGAGPLRSGTLILPYVLFEAVGGITGAVYIHQSGKFREPMYLGCLLMTIGTGLVILFDINTPLSQVIGFQIVAGLGAGWIFEPPLIALQSLVQQDDVATATGLFGFTRNLAASISIVIGGVVFQNGMNRQRHKLQVLGLPESLISRYSGHDAEANILSIGTIQNVTQQHIVKNGYSASLQNMWIMYTVFSGCTLIASLFIGKSVLSTEHVETKTGLKEVPGRAS
jgi:hypothetical protein